MVVCFCYDCGLKWHWDEKPPMPQGCPNCFERLLAREFAATAKILRGEEDGRKCCNAWPHCVCAKQPGEEE